MFTICFTIFVFSLMVAIPPSGLYGRTARHPTEADLGQISSGQTADESGPQLQVDRQRNGFDANHIVLFAPKHNFVLAAVYNGLLLRRSDKPLFDVSNTRDITQPGFRPYPALGQQAVRNMG